MADSTNAAAALQETLQKISAKLLPAIEELSSSTNNNGLDFLHAKNTLLLTYLIDWVVLVRDGSTDTQQQRLLEMRTILQKIPALDKKLRYQIDKLLAQASAASSSYVTRNHDVGPEDPLQFRPDPTSLLEDDEENDDDNDSDNEEPNSDDDDSADENDDDDEDLAAARQALAISKKKSSSSKKDSGDGDAAQSEIYRAPRLTAVPYTHDVQAKKSIEDKRQKRRLRVSELAQTLRDQYGEAPDQEDVHGHLNDLYGKQRSAMKKLERQQAERQEYEESNMIRLMTSRKEKKEKKRIERMMEGGSNLAQIANLNNLVRETQAIGRDDDHDDDGMDEEMARSQALQDFYKNGSGGEQKQQYKQSDRSGRHANGKRRRDRGEEYDGSGGGSSKKGRMPKPQNSLQAALYGGGGSASSSSKKSKRKAGGSRR